MASLDNIYEFTDKEDETEVQKETGMNDGKLLYILTHSPTYPPMSVCLSVFLQLKTSLSFIKQYNLKQKITCKFYCGYGDQLRCFKNLTTQSALLPNELRPL